MFDRTAVVLVHSFKFSYIDDAAARCKRDVIDNQLRSYLYCHEIFTIVCKLYRFYPIFLTIKFLCVLSETWLRLNYLQLFLTFLHFSNILPEFNNILFHQFFCPACISPVLFAHIYVVVPLFNIVGKLYGYRKESHALNISWLMGCLFDILGSRKTFSFLNYVLSFARASGLSLSSLPPTNFTHLLFCCRCRRFQAQSLALCECMFVYICVSVFLSLYVRVCLGRLLSSYMKFSFYILHLKMVFMNGRMP